MPLRIRVLSPEHRPINTHPLHVPSDSHLHKELRTLRKIRLSVEVLDLEDSSSTLGSSTSHIRWLNPFEFVLPHVFRE